MSANALLTALQNGDTQVGIWQNLPGTAAAEIAASSGVDWVLFDQEHAPRSHEDLLASLNAAERRGAHTVVRAAGHNREEIGRLLDMGVQNVLIPMVESGAEARAIAQACEFAPHGTRGVSAQTRAGSWGSNPAFLSTARDGICVIAQIESLAGVDHVREIAETPGIDVIFVGAADLAASMGRLGNPGHPDVRAAVSLTIAAARSAGRPVGVLVKDHASAEAAHAEGCRFIGIATDTAILVRGLTALTDAFPPHRKAAQ